MILGRESGVDIDRVVIMAKPRTPIPEDISAEVMFQHDWTCCVCRNRGLSVQIHHIDEDSTNHAIQNLAVLCLEDHDQTQTKGGFAKRLKAADVIRHRDDWVQRVNLRRDKAEEILLRKMAGLESRQRLQIEDWTSPSEARVVGFLHALPGLRKAVITAARPLWDTGITSEMCQGSYDAIGFLERAWLQLAKFFLRGISMRSHRSNFLVSSCRRDSDGIDKFVNRLVRAHQEHWFLRL
jgi:hypothetical protein